MTTADIPRNRWIPVVVVAAVVALIAALVATAGGSSANADNQLDAYLHSF